MDVDRLAVRDRQHPGAQIGVRAQLRIGAQRREERLLKRVIGVVAPERGDEEAQHVVALRVEEALEGRQSRGVHGDITILGPGS